MTRDIPTPARPADLSTLLRDEHARLDATFESLMDGFRADPLSVGLLEWKHFEAALRAHLSLEEDLVLPTFERTYPLETAQIRDEHASIRRELDELGLGVELHLISPELIDRFISKLRAHAAHEDAMLYERVDRELTPDERSRAIARVHETARRISGTRPGLSHEGVQGRASASRASE